MSNESLGVQRQINELCRRYESSVRTGGDNSFDVLLNEIDAPHRPALFRELIAIEFDVARERNATIDAHSYCTRYPDWVHIIREMAEASIENTIDYSEPNSGGSTNDPNTQTFIPDSEAWSHASRTSHRGSNCKDQPSIDGYEIIDVLGRGGMGVVYKARDERLKRLVALKMILAGEHAGDGHLKRFRAEAEAVARLQHTNIVQIHDVGEQNGNPFLSLEFVDGPDLSKYCAGEPQKPDFAARLVESMARAMDYAHQQGVIHRDLKPGNVLLSAATPRSSGSASGHGSKSTAPDQTDDVTENPDLSDQPTLDDHHEPNTPDRVGSTLRGSSNEFSAGMSRGSSAKSATSDDATTLGVVPKITDFGLAKQMDVDSEMTSTGQILGTPSYMAPEQADGRVSDIGPLTDVYSLGAILYTLLTGRPPFQATSALETILMVRNSDPVPPSQLQPLLSIDIETICLTCLQKDSTRRYRSAADLADELRRFLEDKPILARPVGRVEKFRRWCRRNPIVATLSAACLVLFAVGFALVAWQWREAEAANNSLTVSNSELTVARGQLAQKLIEVEEQKGQIQAERDEANRQKEEANKQKGLAQGERVEAERQRDEADKQKGIARQERDHAKLQRDKAERRLYLDQIRSAALNLETNNVAAAVPKLNACQADRRGWEYRYLNVLIDRTQPHRTIGRGMFPEVAVGPHSNRIAIARSSTFTIQDIRTGEIRSNCRTSDNITGLVFSPDGNRIVTTSSKGMYRSAIVTVWEFGSNKLNELKSFKGDIKVLAFHKDGRRIIGVLDNTLRVMDIETGKETASLTVQQGLQNRFHIHVSNDGTRIIASDKDKVLRLFDTNTLKEITSRPVPYLPRAFSDDGDLIVVADGYVLKLLDADTLEDRLMFRGRHSHYIVTAAFSLDGKWVASGDVGGSFAIWDTASGEPMRTCTGHPEAIQQVEFSRNGEALITVGDLSSIKRWDVTSGEKPSTFAIGAVHSVTFHPNGEQIVCGGPFPTAVTMWNVLTQKKSADSGGRETRFAKVAISPDGNLIVAGDSDGVVRSWDAQLKKEKTLHKHDGQVAAVAFSPNGRQIITTFYGDTTCILWDVESAKVVKTFDNANAVAFSPDGHYIATGGRSASLKLRSVETGETIREYSSSHKGSLYDLSFSPNGKDLASCGGTSLVVHNVATGELKMELKGHTGNTLNGGIYTLAYSPDGTRIVSGAEDRVLKLWDAKTGENTLTLKGHSSRILDVNFSPDGNQIVSAAYDKTVKIWDARTPAAHADAAKVAEQREDWYAAAFHLGWMLKATPNTGSLLARRSRAVSKLHEQGMMIPSMPDKDRTSIP